MLLEFIFCIFHEYQNNKKQKRRRRRSSLSGGGGGGGAHTNLNKLMKTIKGLYPFDGGGGGGGALHPRPINQCNDTIMRITCYMYVTTCL